MRGIPGEKARLKEVQASQQLHNLLQATCSGALTAKQAGGNPVRPTGVAATSWGGTDFQCLEIQGLWAIPAAAALTFRGLPLSFPSVLLT